MLKPSRHHIKLLAQGERLCSVVEHQHLLKAIGPPIMESPYLGLSTTPTECMDGDIDLGREVHKMTPRPRSESEERTTKALTLSQNELHLLRGIPINRLLRSGAAVLSSNEGSASSYNLSKQVSELGVFLSHNWSVTRFRKFISLIFHFNMAFALASTSLVSFSLLCFEVFGVLPLPVSVGDLSWAGDYWDHDDLADAKCGGFAYLFATPVFLLALFFKQDILSHASPGMPIFLDKVSIHQTDQQLKQAGIQKIGAFLAKSSAMVIVYSDVYLQKLWTVYELACFLQVVVAAPMHHRIEVVHIAIAPIILFGGTFAYLITFTRYIPSLSKVAQLGYALIAICVAAILRKRRLSLASTWQGVRTFRVADAICADENDRPVVEGNIEAFLKSGDYVPEHASRASSLEVFDRLVQQNVLRRMQACLDPPVVILKHIMILVCLIWWVSCLERVVGLARMYGMLDFKTWGAFLHFAALTFVNVAAGVLLGDWFMSKCLHLSGWRNWAWILCGSLMVFVFMLVLSLGQKNMLIHARTSNTFFFCFVILHAAFWAFAATVCFQYRQRAKPKALGQ